MKKNVRNSLITLLIILLLLSPLLVQVVKLYRIEMSYHSIGVSFQQIALESVRRTLENQGIDTAMPGNGNDVITFTAPHSFPFEDTAYNPCHISRGDTLTCDFVTWSHDFFRERMVTLTVNGKKHSAKLSTSDLTKLYKAALEQNGLEAQFEADTGKKLTTRSAREAIRALDKTLFERGIHKAYDYPYDRRMVKLVLSLCVLFSLPIALLLMGMLSLMAESVQYRLWLREYNKENQGHWDNVAGNLPQFVSLRESGLKGAIPIHKKEKLPARILSMFKPDKTIK